MAITKLKVIKPAGYAGTLNVLQLEGGKTCIRVDWSNGKQDWPVRKANGEVIWDDIDRVPKYLRELACTVFNVYKANDMKIGCDHTGDGSI